MENFSTENLQDQNSERKKTNFNLSTLRSVFHKEHLDQIFALYVQRIQNSYFSLFLLLQFILGTIHVIVLVIFTSNLYEILPDLLCYCTITILSLVTLIVKEYTGSNCITSFPLVTSMVTITVLITCNTVLIPLLHMNDQNYQIRPAYTSHAIIAVYVFLPVTYNSQALAMGIGTTCCNLLVLGLATFRNYETLHPGYKMLAHKLLSDGIYMACINGMGLYFRFMSEILKRKTFLDHRACVKNTQYLIHEEDQEEQLMSSILPQHIVNRVREDIKNTLHYLQTNTIPVFKTFREMYVEHHENVTILYADIARYTEMTRRLTVTKLVETLNDLFSKFDDASIERDVLRIKFLGDCYYCVSGIPVKTPNHAINCVEFALDMITIIQDVRRKRNLDIDMRIGVHSGAIWGGLIGKCKWQYDIWSEDVDIANRMEQKGQPGKVHVTNRTLELLDSKFDYVESNAASGDEFLQKLGIRTYLISPNQCAAIRNESNIFSRKQSENKNRSFIRPNPLTPSGIKLISHRRTAFMAHNIEQYLRINATDQKLEETITKLPLGKFEQWFQSSNISPLFLTFRNWKLECPYFVLPDLFFKYYLLSSVCVLFFICILHYLLEVQLVKTSWLLFVTLGLIFLVCIPLWSQSVYKLVEPFLRMLKYRHPEETTAYLTRISFCKEISNFVATNTVLRMVIYFIVCSLIAACTLLDLVKYVNDSQNTQKLCCEVPWNITKICSLAIVASFLYLRIHLAIKLLVGMIVTFVFSYYILKPEFVDQETWNPGLKTNIACIMSIACLTFTLHLIDRQAEYLSRLDYLWKRQLALEQKEAQTMHRINILLLQNILPMHVVQIYLDASRFDDELYHEHYKSVAVMFATVVDHEFSKDDVNADISTSTIEIMNEVISEFDKLLLEPCGERIEKIKATGWTYMAACGLDPSRRDSTASTLYHLNQGSSYIVSSMQSEDFEKEEDEEEDLNNGCNIVVHLVRFGLEMMRVLDTITGRFSNFQLRIGISHGEVTAGVVGSRKPLYDIWGDTVNMASRMDSTGEKGRIQVTQNTAHLLRKSGIRCTFRGDTFIKGLEIHIPTYFVDISSVN